MGNQLVFIFLLYNFSMGKVDKQKESIGYLKVVFSILVAIDVSLVAWIFKNNVLVDSGQIIVPSVIVLFITISLIYVNKIILKKIDQLEEM